MSLVILDDKDLAALKNGEMVKIRDTANNVIGLCTELYLKDDGEEEEIT